MRSLPLLLLCIGLVLLQGDLGWCRGGRGGGSRGGSRGGYRGGGSSSYRAPAYRAYRSSGGYSGMATRRYNYYRSNNYYLSYVPTVRYTRSYSLAIMGSLYWSYYSRYYYYVGTAKYASRGTPPKNSTSSVCANYAAGENGTYMGLFVCPLDFEPATFTACCGDDYEEYCCEPTPEFPGWAIALIVIGCIGVIAAFYGYCYWRNNKQKQRTSTPVRPVQGSRANIHRPPGQQPNTVTGNVNYGYVNPKCTTPQGGLPMPPPYPGKQQVAPPQYPPPPQQNGGYANDPAYPTRGSVPSDLPPGYTAPGHLAPLEPQYGFRHAQFNPPPPPQPAPASTDVGPTDRSIAPPQSALY